MAGGGGTEPNLTPFIDLFSVLVCFLLMSAAWIQLESVAVGVDKKPTPSANNDTPPPEPEPPKDKKVKLSIKMFADKIVVSEDETEIATLPQGHKLDEPGLGRILSTWKTRFPERKDIIVNSDSSITYGQLIGMYDFLVQSDWNEVGINPY